MKYQWRHSIFTRDLGEKKNTLFINNIPEPQGNENSTHLFKEPDKFFTPISDTYGYWEFLASAPKSYFQGSVYNMMFLT